MLGYLKADGRSINLSPLVGQLSPLRRGAVPRTHRILLRQGMDDAHIRFADLPKSRALMPG
jgi:hypothetical protein